jgi:hypothetical protein
MTAFQGAKPVLVKIAVAKFGCASIGAWFSIKADVGQEPPLNFISSITAWSVRIPPATAPRIHGELLKLGFDISKWSRRW